MPTIVLAFELFDWSLQSVQYFGRYARQIPRAKESGLQESRFITLCYYSNSICTMLKFTTLQLLYNIVTYRQISYEYSGLCE